MQDKVIYDADSVYRISDKTVLDLEDGKSKRRVGKPYFLQDLRMFKTINKEINIKMPGSEYFVKRKAAEIMEFICEVK